jgi:hypothetical protein
LKTARKSESRTAHEILLIAQRRFAARGDQAQYHGGREGTSGFCIDSPSVTSHSTLASQATPLAEILATQVKSITVRPARSGVRRTTTSSSRESAVPLEGCANTSGTKSASAQISPPTPAIPHPATPRPAYLFDGLTTAISRVFRAGFYCGKHQVGTTGWRRVSSSANAKQSRKLLHGTLEFAARRRARPSRFQQAR